jgi:CheY-like chemotaxis protein
MNHPSFPTVLVAELEKEISDLLTSNLRRFGYFVLEAEDAAEALEVVKIHSRPIHLMLTSAGPHSQNLAATVKPYRPHMGVIFVSSDASPDFVLNRVYEVISPPRRVAAAG